MPVYKAPTQDMYFILNEVFNAEETLTKLPDFEDATQDIIEAVIEEASKVVENEIAPINLSGHEEGCKIQDGKVSTPKGFKEAFRTYVESGWNALSCPVEYGGQGLPHTLNSAVEEMLCAANTSFSLYPSLTNGAIHAINQFAPKELKELYLPKMIEGTWTGAMDMTEPSAGSDLSLVRTKATPNGDGTFAITGTKIFITAGDHDLAENVVHLVLARLPDAPQGTRGISMFLVPKFLPNEQGEIGEYNNVSVGSIEHKMGINGSATCVMNYDSSKGWLVGEENKGLIAMFAMMNTERMFVGLQGLGLADVAYQNAVEYAKERLQGRSPLGAKSTEKPADSILVHPNVRDDLLFARSFVEAGRALNFYTAINLDVSKKHPDSLERQKADDRVALIVPIIKAGFTDLAYEACTKCQGVLGGHGYVREWGLEQFVRDCRITQIYEGTNHIQSLDLAGRKININEGRLFNSFVEEMESFISNNKSNENIKPFVLDLESKIILLKEATKFIQDNMKEDRALLQSASMSYLHMFTYIVLAYMWCLIAEKASEKQNEEFYAKKMKLCKYYFARTLPRCSYLLDVIKSGSETIMLLEDDEF